MKKIVTLLVLLLFLGCTSSYAQTLEGSLNMSDVDTFSEKNKFGLQDKNGNIVVKPVYKKLIRLGDSAWIAQKGNRFGLIDSNGATLIEPKFRHAERLYRVYAKLGNENDYGLYDESGNAIIAPEYSKIDPLFGRMFLTYKDYKYGVISSDGKVVIDNEFDDIYMPNPNSMRLKYEGEWYEVEKIAADEITLPENSKKVKVGGSDIKITRVISDTGIISSYGALTVTDYTLKLFSSISPSYEETIDELMLSQGAETVSIFMRLGWLPKFPVTYAKKYYHNIMTPANGPLSDVRYNVRRRLNNR